MGMFDFKEKSLSLYNNNILFYFNISLGIDKEGGTIEITMDIDGVRQPLEGSTDKPCIYNLNDAKIGETFETLEFTVTDHSDIAILFRLEEKQSVLQKSKTLAVNKEVKYNASEVPIFKNNAFADRLKFFQKKDKKEPEPPPKLGYVSAKPQSTNDKIKELNPNKPNQLEKTCQEEMLLQPVAYGALEEKIPKIANLMVDTFCEGFFLSSFPTAEGKVIEGSQSYKSICGHELCSMLPAMQPEIIARYPLKDTKTLELNDLAATICFPSGIKICYGGSEQEMEEPPSVVKNYSSPITNQQGDRYYMMTYHFYYKVYNGEFTKQYEIHPLKHHMHKFAEGYIGLEIDKQTEKKIQDNLEICQEFNFRDFVYVPYCLTLISKFPYVNQMEKCLQGIYNILSDFSGNYNINKIIEFLVHGITVPHIGTNIKFFIPFYSYPIQINCPKIDDFQIITNNLTNLLNLFSIQNIITIFRLILFEKKILFVGKDYSILSEVTDSFISLIYPLQWVHTYIPIMSDQMIQYLQTFLPFINGIHETLLPFVQETLIENEDEVYMIYVEVDEVKKKPKSRIDLNRNLINKKKINVEDKINETTPKIPIVLQKKLNTELKAIKDRFDNLIAQFGNSLKSETVQNPQYERERAGLDLKLRNLFIDIFVEMFYDYRNYLKILEDDYVFNSNLLIENRPKDDKEFYKEFTESQLFEQFIQRLGKGEFYYFGQKIQCKLQKKSMSNELQQKSIIKDHYLIEPKFLPYKSTPKNTKELEQDLRKKFESNLKYSYENGINKESNRIIGKLNKIEDTAYELKNAEVYLYPDVVFKEEEKKVVENAFTSKLKFFQNAAEKKKQMIVGEPGEKEKDTIKEDIKDIIVKIFKGEDIQSVEKEKKVIIQNMKYPFVREHFINNLCKNDTVNYLQDASFKALADIIFQSMLEILKSVEDDKIIEQSVNLFRSSIFFALASEKKKNTNMFDTLKMKFKGYSLFMKPKYWNKWFDITVKEKKITKDFEKLIPPLCKVMLELRLDKEFINTTLEGIINRSVTDEAKSEETKNLIKSHISKCKY